MDWLFVIIICVLAVFGVISLSKGRESLRYLFYFWVASFHFGPRGIELGAYRMFLIEGVTLAVFFIFLLRFNLNVVSERKMYPPQTLLLILITAGGILNGILRDFNFVGMLAEASVFFILVPVFYITHVGFKHLGVELSAIFNIFLWGAVVLSLGSVIFSLFPGLADMLPETLISGESILIDVRRDQVKLAGGEEFERAGGSFWGLLLISAYYALLLTPLWVNSLLPRAPSKKLLFKGSCLLMFLGIVITGQRSVWLGLLLGLAFYSWQRGAKGIFLAALAALAGLPLVPEKIIMRFFSTFDPFQQTVAIRLERYTFATNVWKENILLGSGWTASGWAHNFILQLGANIGIFGLIVFLFWLGKIFFTSHRLYQKKSGQNFTRNVQLSFLVGVIIYLGPMIGESVINWTVFMVPYWFFCAVLHNYNNGNIDL